MSKTQKLDVEQTRQLVKVVVVLLRDYSPLRFQEFIEIASYCWRHTGKYNT